MGFPTHSVIADGNSGDSERTTGDRRRLPSHKKSALSPVFNSRRWPLEINLSRINADQVRCGLIWCSSSDTWDSFKEAKSLAQKLDHFEAIKRVHKKPGLAKTWERRTYDKPSLESKNKLANFSGKGRNVGSLNRILLGMKSKGICPSLERGKETSDGVLNENRAKLAEFVSPSEGEEKDSLEIPAFEEGGEMSLAELKGSEFIEEQRKMPGSQAIMG
ncbi:hypothetical protein TNCT_246431 [Trichonephila clavata]|uniref:Uncharacterized protein n=1 Tax=Trichonephila clavata TaxID=2740835 RepID=A0A8X6H849_TRICU|nr:hypothetical protein TNCT_246431 [Trichonephila clavata]